MNEFPKQITLYFFLFESTKTHGYSYIGRSFKFILKVDIEESIVNARLVSLHSKNTNNAKSDPWYVIRGAFAIDSSTPTLRWN
jgi:hypothetical protein